MSRKCYRWTTLLSDKYRCRLTKEWERNIEGVWIRRSFTQNILGLNTDLFLCCPDSSNSTLILIFLFICGLPFYTGLHHNKLPLFAFAFVPLLTKHADSNIKVKACYTLFNAKSSPRQISAIMCDGCSFNNNMFHPFKLPIYSDRHKEEISASVRVDGLHRWVISAWCVPVSGQNGKHSEDTEEHVNTGTWLLAK